MNPCRSEPCWISGCHDNGTRALTAPRPNEFQPNAWFCDEHYDWLFDYFTEVFA